MNEGQNVGIWCQNIIGKRFYDVRLLYLYSKNVKTRSTTQKTGNKIALLSLNDSTVNSRINFKRTNSNYLLLFIFHYP